MKFGIAGVIVGLILLFILPWWVGLVIIAAAIGIPLGGYLMLDPSQRRRIKRIRRRQIDG
jgi:Flp pilus assembly protein TadB